MLEIKIAITDVEKSYCYELRKQIFVEEQKVPIEREMDEYDESSIHFAVYDKDTLIGTGRTRLLDNYAKLERICILPTNRGCNIGSQLIQKIEEYWFYNGITCYRLSSQAHVAKFYEKLGYIVISEKPYIDAGILHVLMEKNLDGNNSEILKIAQVYF